MGICKRRVLVGQRELLKGIKRRTTFSSCHDSCIELRREKQMLTMELVNLRQKLQTTKSCIKAMEERIEGAEKKQKQMMPFLARATQSPSFLQKLLKQRDRKVKEIEDDAERRRKRGSSITELEALALEIQGYKKQRNMTDEEEEEVVIDRELDDGFWEDLLRN